MSKKIFITNNFPDVDFYILIFSSDGFFLVTHTFSRWEANGENVC